MTASRGKALKSHPLHLTPGEQAGLLALVERLRQRYGDDLLRVVLFGSKVRGDFDAESDLDVLVVVRDGDYWQCWREITDLTTRLLLETGVNISALVRDEARYQWWAVHHAPIYHSIQRDGVEIGPGPASHHRDPRRQVPGRPGDVARGYGARPWGDTISSVRPRWARFLIAPPAPR